MNKSVFLSVQLSLNQRLFVDCLLQVTTSVQSGCVSHYTIHSSSNRKLDTCVCVCMRESE